MFTNSINPFGKNIETGHISNISGNGSSFNMINETEKASFKDVITDMANGINKELNAPDEMLNSIMRGSSEHDIHDVMIALSKADMGITIATTAATKVLQTYEKIMQIQL